MKKINCEIISDLLPLYIDEVCTESTTEVVEEHIESCKACKEKLHQMKADLPSVTAPIKFSTKSFFQQFFMYMIGLIVVIGVVLFTILMSNETTSFVITPLYIIFWVLYTYLVKKNEYLLNLSFLFGILTLLSAICHLVVCHLDVREYLYYCFALANVPFQGLTRFLSDSVVNIFVTIISFVWFVYIYRLRFHLLKRLYSGDRSYKIHVKMLSLVLGSILWFGTYVSVIVALNNAEDGLPMLFVFIFLGFLLLYLIVSFILFIVSFVKTR